MGYPSTKVLGCMTCGEVLRRIISFYHFYRVCLCVCVCTQMYMFVNYVFSSTMCDLRLNYAY